MLERVLDGVAEVLGENIRIRLTDGNLAFIPSIVIQGRKPEVGDRIQIRIRKEHEDDTGEWSIIVLGPTEHRAARGDSPFFREDLGRPIKKD